MNYGRYDLDKLVESARLVTRTEGDYLAYHPDGVYALEEMLLARYHMHRQVYGHKTRLATDHMLVRAMLLGVEEGVLPTGVFKPETLDGDFVEEYLRWDDRRVVDVLGDAVGSRAGDIMRALRERRLLKRIGTITIDDLGEYVDRMAAGYAIQPEPTVLAACIEGAEEAVAEAAGVDRLWVVLQWENLQNPLSAKDDPRVSDKEILITDPTGNRVADKFSEVSEVFRGQTVGSRRHVSVYVGSTERRNLMSVPSRILSCE